MYNLKKYIFKGQIFFINFPMQQENLITFQKKKKKKK